MKIIIVGGGIAGLSTYLHLRAHLPNPDTHTISIYESHRPRPSQSDLPPISPSPDQTTTPPPPAYTLDVLSASTALVGGGLGISPNGMRILRSLNPALHSAVVAQGYPTSRFVFRGANGWVLGSSPTTDATVRDDAHGEEEVCVASSRHGLREVLMQFVLADGASVRYLRVTRVVGRTSGERACVWFSGEDGAEGREEADLIVGADGVKSAVRGALFSAEDEDDWKPVYTGMSGIGGFFPASLLEAQLQRAQDPSAMHFTFGRNGFFGYSLSSRVTASAPATMMWWSTYEAPLDSDPDPAAIKAALRARHKEWRDPVIQDIISKADVQSVYPTWTLDTLPHWGAHGIVLIGDAAHALDPTTGQGASQALEDSLTLSLLLSSLLSSSTHTSSITEQDRIDAAIKLLYKVRSARVKEIAERGKKMSGRKADVGVVAEYAMYFFLWTVTRWPVVGRWMLGDVHRRLYTWDAVGEVRRAVARWKDQREGEL